MKAARSAPLSCKARSSTAGINSCRFSLEFRMASASRTPGSFMETSITKCCAAGHSYVIITRLTMRVLVVGYGGREHALVWRLSKSKSVKEIFCAPGNPGIAELASCVPIESSNIVELADFALSVNINLTVVGPELPLDLGIVDEFNKRNLAIFGPSKAAAELESSKVFAKEFMKKHKIPTARFTTAGSMEEALA